MYFNAAMQILTPEEYLIMANKDQILGLLKEYYADRYNIDNIPIHLHAHYYKCGLLYLPDRVTKQCKSTVAIDCGAWVGDTAIMLNDYGFSEIHCFEPHPTTVETLKTNLRANKNNGNFRIHHKAVGNTCSTLMMADEGYLGGGSKITDSGSIPVETVTLDSFWKSTKRVGLLKLDVEGFEENVLEGAIKLIKRDKPILLIAVYHEDASPGQMIRVQQFINDLKLGYKFIFRGMQPDYGMIYEYDLICYIDNEVTKDISKK